MSTSATHLLLTIGSDRNDAQARVEHFFTRNFLVKYDRVSVLAERTIHAGETDFWGRLEEGVAANRRLVGELLAELQGGGFERVTDLGGMAQGYDSKVLHTVTHLLDGFFGVDTFFYNLEEDSHGVSARLATAIKAHPGGFWLVEAECTSDPGHDPDRLDPIRRFETEPPP